MVSNQPLKLRTVEVTIATVTRRPVLIIRCSCRLAHTVRVVVKQNEFA